MSLKNKIDEDWFFFLNHSFSKFNAFFFFYIEKIENYFLEDQRTIILNYFKQLFLRDKIDNQCISITRIQHTWVSNNEISWKITMFT